VLASESRKVSPLVNGAVFFVTAALSPCYLGLPSQIVLQRSENSPRVAWCFVISSLTPADRLTKRLVKLKGSGAQRTGSGKEKEKGGRKGRRGGRP